MNKIKEFKFKIKQSEYDFVFGVAKKYKEQYNTFYHNFLALEKQALLEFNYEREIALIKLQKETVLSYMKEFLTEIKLLEKNNIIVFLTGSFSRGSNKAYSDLDFHIVHTNRKGKLKKGYEELIYLSLSYIFKLPRKSIHPMFSTSYDERRYHKKNVLNLEKMVIKLTNEKNEIISLNEVNKHYMKRFYLQYKNNKNLRHMIKVISKKHKNKLYQEWANNLLALNHVGEFNKLYAPLLNAHFNQLNEAYFAKKVKMLNESIYEIFHFIKDSKLNTIKEVKKLYQMKLFYFIYEFLLYLREKEAYTSKNLILLENISFLNLMSENKDSSFTNELQHYYKMFIQYLWYVKRLCNISLDNKIAFSIHLETKINSEILNYCTEINDYIEELLLTFQQKLK